MSIKDLEERYDDLNGQDSILQVIDLERIIARFVNQNYGTPRLMNMLLRALQKGDPVRGLPELGQMLEKTYREWLKSHL